MATGTLHAHATACCLFRASAPRREREITFRASASSRSAEIDARAAPTPRNDPRGSRRDSVGVCFAFLEALVDLDLRGSERIFVIVISTDLYFVRGKRAMISFFFFLVVFLVGV